MRACTAGAAIAAAALMLSGCGGSYAGSAPIPATQAAAHPGWYRAAPAIAKKGVYIAEYYTNAILGYEWATKLNRPPICSITASFAVDVATDATGNLIDPDGGSRTVTVFKGPAMCGTALGSFKDSDGQPSDAATWNAASDAIYVANLQATGKPYGNVSVCTLAQGCNAILSSSAIGGQLFAVAEDRHGNVYASGYPNPSVSGPGSGAALVYWKRGKGNAIVLSAYKNSTPGGLSLDTQGNLVALDTFGHGVYVYTGCPKSCVARGPFQLKGESVYGKVDARGNELQVADAEYGQIDVYRYRGTHGIAYLYSYNDGLSPSGDVEGIALDPGVAR